MRRWLLVALALALAAAACGTRVSKEDAAAFYARQQATPRQPVPAPTQEGASGAAGPAAASGDVREEGRSTAVAGPGGDGPAPGGERTPTTIGTTTTRSETRTTGTVPSAGSGTTPLPGAPGGATARPKEPINVGQVGVLSGPIGANMKAIADGVRVWVRWINERGGINGHAVNLLQGDSGADPARHRALVQQFVEQKKVVAFVGQPGDVFSGSGSVDYLTKAGVPVVGSEGGANWYYQSPVFFPQMVHGRILVQALALGASSEMKRRQQSKLALWTCVEAQTCSDIAEVFPKVVPRNNVTVVQQSKISIGQPDFTAECFNGRNAGAEAIIVSADGATISRAAASCARQGYKPSWGFFGAQILAKQHAEDPNLDNALVLDLTAPWFLTDTPLRKEFVDAAARYAPTIPTGSPMANGWVAGKVFQYAATRAAEPLTPPTILAALGAVRGDVLPDLTGPLLFNPGKPATPTACLWNETLNGGRWATPDRGQRHCFDFDPSI
jgi:branched-chain amino acid transport system substrate-binding protein